MSAYVAAAVIATLAGALLLQVWRADLRVPLRYEGDALSFALPVKSVVDHGWYLQNPSLGAPTGLQLYDFPYALHNVFHLGLIKAMALFSKDWALLFNLYFLLGFPLIALSALAVLRAFRVGYGPAIVASVLYAVLPSRLIKAQGHLFLDTFFQVPLAILILLWTCSDDPPLTRAQDGERRPRLDLRGRRSLVAIGICAFLAATELYYAFFTACLLVAGGVWAAIERRSLRNLVAGIGLAATLTVGLGIVGLPAIVHRARHGPNPAVAVRGPGEAEIFGLKVAQLLLPVDGHRLPALRRLKQRYTAHAPLIGENSTTSLGLLGGVGFLVLLGVLLRGPRAARPREDVLRPLSVLNVMAVLLATIGGVGSLFALLVSSQIRTYSRINVLIAFFALFTFALLLDRLRERNARLGYAVLPFVLGFGLWDQGTLLARGHYDEAKERYASDADMVRRIEAAVPPGGMIFELPYMTFPEGRLVDRLEPWQPLRPYLHSRTLRWSFPAMRGRPGDVWARELGAAEPAQMVAQLRAVGFRGILVQRDGYPDNGAKIEAQLRLAISGEPLVSPNGQLAFYDLGHEGGETGGEGDGRLSFAERERVLHPVVFTWPSGFYDLEQDARVTYRWGESSAEARIENDSALERKIAVKMRFGAAHPPARLIIEGDLLTASVEIDAAGVSFERLLTIPPGSHVIRFHCDGKPAVAPRDPRVMIWRIENFAFNEL